VFRFRQSTAFWRAECEMKIEGWTVLTRVKPPLICKRIKLVLLLIQRCVVGDFIYIVRAFSSFFMLI
jgi:hypothetical protein